MNEKKSLSEIVRLAFKAIALATATAAIVLNTLGAAPLETVIILLSIGLFSLAVSSM